jgi:hypothetical protein
MNHAVRPRFDWRRPVPPVGESPPPPAACPAQCAYCGVWPPTVLCGQEHTAYAGEWLCPRCYARLFEGPVLLPQAEQARPEERGVL